MKKVLFKLSCLAFALGILTPFSSKASHLVGGDLTYIYDSVPNTYTVVLRLYRDCSGIAMNTSYNVCYRSTSGCFPDGSMVVNLLPGSGQPIPPSTCVPVPPGGTTCTGGTGYGVEEYRYEATVVLPGACNDWYFEFAETARNGGITTLVPAGFYLKTTLNNLDFPTNSSPFFSTIPVTQFCINNQFYFDQGAYDVDGDSITYALVAAEDCQQNSNINGCPFSPSFPCTYNSPYNALNPLSTVSGTSCDLYTGTISFVPNMLQIAVIAVQATEYDRTTQQVKSTIKRDIQVNIVNTCIIAPPGFDSTLVSTGINIVVDGITNVACDDSVFYLTLNPPVQCGSIVPSDIRFYDPTGTSNPVAGAVGVNCVNGLTDSIRVTLINPISLGTSYILTRVGFDGNTFLSECGSPMDEFDTLFINLTDSSAYYFNIADTVDCAFTSLVLHSNQQISCNEVAADGSDFILLDANGDTIPIVSAVCNGLLPGGLFNSEFTLNLASTTNAVGPLTLMVQQGSDLNTFSNACKNFVLQNDTIGHIQLRNNITINLGNDITTCSNSATPQLFAGLLPPYVHYTWTLDNNPTASDTASITAGTSGTYIVTAAASASCQGSDTVVVNILTAPSVALGNDITLCSGTTIPQLDAGNPGASFQWYQNGVALANDTLQFYTPATGGTYMVTANVGGICLGRDTINITVAAPLDVTVTDLSLCAGTSATLQSTSANTGVSYQWTLNGAVIAGQTGTSIPVNQGGNYQVIISINSGTSSCSDSSSAIVTAIEQPTAQLSDITQCDAFPVLNPGYPANGTFNTQYAWTLGGSPTGGNTPTLTTAANGNYGVTITNTFNGVNCTATASMNLAVGTTPQIIDLTDDVILCNNQASSATLVVTSSGAADTYQWSLGTNAISGATSNTYVATSTGVYKIVVTGTGNCNTSGNVTVVIGANPLPVIEDTTDNSIDSVLFCAGQGTPILGLVSPQTGYSYNWLLNGLQVSTSASVSVNAIGTYKVIVTDAQGCSGDDNILVVPGICDVTPPNIITPDGDAQNEFFVVPGLLEYATRKLTVYNRWGNEVYSANPYNNDWNGGDLAAGTYFYTLELFNNIKTSTKNGYLQIVK